jgi:AraC-like DNA-binding protein
MFAFLISGGGLLFFFFAIFSVLNTQGNVLLNRLFGFALFSRFCQILTYYLTLTGDAETLYLVYPINNIMQFASPVFFVLYVQAFIFDKSKLSWRQYLHFIPAVIMLLDVIFWFSLPAQDTEGVLQGFVREKQFFGTQPYSIVPEWLQHPVRRGLALVYLIVAWVLIVKNTQTQVWGVQKRWMYFLVSAMSANQILLTVQYIVLIQAEGAHQDLFLAPYQVLLMMVLFGVLFYDPRLLYGQLLVSDRWKKPVHLEDLKEESGVAEKQEETQRRAPVDEEKIQHYIETMKELMERKQPFLNPDYQISGLSSDLGIPVHHCSYVLNYHMGKGFRDWINGYRVNYFLQQIPRQGSTKTIEAIAVESGFKNNTTFYNAFKKEKGVLPGDYIKDRV